MDDDQTPPTDPIPEAPAPEPIIEVPSEPVEPTDPLPTDISPLAPESGQATNSAESPISIPTPIPVEDQNEGSNQPESITPEPQNQVPDQSGFIHGLLVRAQAKIQSNRQKKLDKLMALAEKKGA
jgi:hypothetical protein